MSYSDQHKRAMAIVYQDIIHLEGVHFEVDNLVDFILNGLADGNPETAIITLEKGADVYGTKVWKEAAERAKKEL